jgi:nitrile hydratase
VNGVHDMGGMHGFGAVVREGHEPVFHTEWERRAFALTLAMGAWKRWNLDTSRFARERMPPVEYLAASYYERWLWGLEALLVERGFLIPEELARVRAGIAADRGSRVPLQEGALPVAAVPRLLRNRRAARRDDPVPARFEVGDRVVARNRHPTGHTRLPRYARGRRGVVARDHGVFVFPDTNALDQAEKPQHVYSVRFEARELWGPDACPRDAVYVDLWDDYLDSA